MEITNLFLIFETSSKSIDSNYTQNFATPIKFLTTVEVNRYFMRLSEFVSQVSSFPLLEVYVDLYVPP